MNNQPRYRFFGILRFVLALLVVFQHYGCNFAGPVVNRWASELLTGSIAVQVFFALSGFIILEAATTFYIGRPGAFLVNRAIRVLVPFAVVVIATWAIYAAIISTHGQALSYDGKPTPVEALSVANLAHNLFFLWPGNVWPLDHNPISFDLCYVFWTVRFELVFYVVCAVALAIGVFRPRLEVPAICISVCFFVVLYVAVLWQASGPGSVAAFNIVLAQLFSLGAVAYIAADRVRLQPFLVAMLVLVIAGYPYVHPGVPTQFIALQTSILVALLITAWMLARVNVKGALKRVDVKLGDLSYPIYLIHVPVQIAVKNIVGAARSDSIALVAAIAALVASVVFARLTDPALKALRSKVRGQTLDGNPTEPVRLGGLITNLDQGVSSVCDERIIGVLSNPADGR